ncbi:DUF2771 domain-containing protein [Rhodococcus aerolatus]
MTRTRLTAAVLALVALVLAGALTAAVVVLLPGGTPENPQLTAYAGGETITVPPTLFCNVAITSCEVGATATLPVPRGKSLQISLPSEIADAPWRLISVFTEPDGTQRTEDRFFRPGERLAVTVGSADPREQVAGAEVQLPSSVVDAQGVPQASATWGISTDPAVINQVQGG